MAIRLEKFWGNYSAGGDGGRLLNAQREEKSEDQSYRVPIVEIGVG
jgi:hypothetical protein